MWTRTTAKVVTALAVVGLFVSVTTAWSRLAAGPPEDQVAAPGPAAARAPVAVDEPREAAPRVVPAVRLSPRVARTDATRLRRATRPERTPRPVRARLGSVGIDAAVRPVGVQPDGQMRLPRDPGVLGWYRFGPAPGSSGATVLAGHLDSRRLGLGPLVKLRDVELGDTVRVAVADGSTTTYRVQSIKRYDRQGLPPAIFSRAGAERLHLITCGGAYDPDDGYELNLVVTAVPTR